VLHIRDGLIERDVRQNGHDGEATG
jgi:hypothetical protein